jgi:hypothetical protein
MRPHLELLEVQIPEGSRGHKAFSVIRGFGWSYHPMILKAACTYTKFLRSAVIPCHLLCLALIPVRTIRRGSADPEDPALPRRSSVRHSFAP